MREQHLDFERHEALYQLARITNYISTHFNINKSTAMLLLDIENAFDTVWHRGFIYKLYLTNLLLYHQAFTKLSEK